MEWTTRKNLGAREERGDRGAWSPRSQEKTAAERGGRPASPDAPEGQVLLPLLPGSPTPAASLVPKRSDRSHVTVGLTSGGWRSYERSLRHLTLSHRHRSEEGPHPQQSQTQNSESCSREIRALICRRRRGERGAST